MKWIRRFVLPKWNSVARSTACDYLTEVLSRMPWTAAQDQSTALPIIPLWPKQAKFLIHHVIQKVSNWPSVVSKEWRTSNDMIASSVYLEASLKKQTKKPKQMQKKIKKPVTVNVEIFFLPLSVGFQGFAKIS